MLQMYMNAAGQPNAQLPQFDVFMMSVFEAMRLHGINPMAWTNQMAMGMTQGQSMQNSQFGANGMLPPLQTQQPPNPDTFGSSSRMTLNRSDSPTYVESPGHSPVSSSAPLPPSSFPSRSRGKERAMSLTPAGKNTPSYHTSSIPSPSESSPRSQQLFELRQAGQVFTSSDSGEALSFFVQIDLRKRLNVVTKIKVHLSILDIPPQIKHLLTPLQKNGGKITNNNASADYAILYSNSKCFPDLLSSTLAAGKLAINADFVHECVREVALLDPTPYLFEGSLKRKRGRPTLMTQTEKQERARQKREIGLQQKEEAREAKKQKQEREKKKIEKKFKKEKENSSYTGPPSPTPPPEHTRRQMASGNFLFSDAEREYVLRYVQILLERDPSVSGTSLASKLFCKVRLLISKSSCFIPVSLV